MFAYFCATLLLWLGAGQLLAPACNSAQPCLAVVRLDDGQTTLKANAIVIVTDDDQDQEDRHARNRHLPDVWIGVRVTAVPPALAAHLGRKGLMIANVVKNSPAERAGLDRYDVVVSFAGRPIAGMDDLVRAIRDTGPDTTVDVVVISAGKERTLQITPVRRDNDAEIEFKYEEPGRRFNDEIEKYFGHRLRLGPHGNALFIPQGRLDRLPDEIKDLLKDWEGKLPEMEWFDDDGFPIPKLPFEMRIEIDTDGDGFRFFMDDRENDDSEIEITIRKDDVTTTIHRNPDGTIRVERQDVDGNLTSATYDDAEALEQGDPEAYELFDRFIRHPCGGFSFKLPDLDRLDKQQRHFQIELQRQLHKAREITRKALREARRAEQSLRDRRRPGVAENTQEVTIRIDDAGRITLRIVEDGTTRTYEFDSRADFEKSEPELYKRFRDALDGAEEPEERSALGPVVA